MVSAVVNACAMLVNPRCHSVSLILVPTLTQDGICRSECLRHVGESPLPLSLFDLGTHLLQIEGERLKIDCWLDRGATTCQLNQVAISEQSNTHLDCWSSEVLGLVPLCE